MTSLQPCSIGSILSEECHKLTLCRQVGFACLDNLSSDQKQLLEWRSGVILDEGNSLCYHHEKKYVSRYEYLQKFCCDPLKLHKIQIKSKLY